MSLLARADWPVVTERVVLRRTTAEDAAAVFAYRTLPEVARWITVWSRDPDEFAEHWAARKRDTVVVLHDDRIVGDLMLRPDDPYRQSEVDADVAGTQAELGWVFDPANGGRGLATEAIRALVDTALGPIGLRRVVAHCFADNAASWRLMERLGMRREAHTRADSLHRDLGWLDGYSYALLAEEWRRDVDPS